MFDPSLSHAGLAASLLHLEFVVLDYSILRMSCVFVLEVLVELVELSEVVSSKSMALE